eukprot:NODE_5715_length_645_cov_464.768456_g5327_i0.p1 GENE.NODE_5715_length_645_cov_464.768456_g5327_i0~~NODE_5715_length_645_cov_464.768456_g5327_i0.p1  ORF type:complete len:119 (+),score=42.89 NODE_5715_length_645_cov_464.768456_g5327_i0:105-461(+)
MPPKKDAKGKDGKGGKDKGKMPTKKKDGKAKKKKWSKGKVREKLNNLVMWEKAARDKLYAEVPKYKLITTAIVSDRLKVNGSLARQALQVLAAEGLIVPVLNAQKCKIFTRVAPEETA